jgi:hypothetical protein
MMGGRGGGGGCTAKNDRFFRVSRQSPKPTTLQDAGFFITGPPIAGRSHNPADRWVVEQVTDTGVGSGKIDRIIRRKVKAIDAEDAGAGKITSFQVHLDRGMHLEEKEGMFVPGDKVGAEDAAGIHAVIDLP